MPNFSHLEQLSDDRGTFEHAQYGKARPEHGYCTDDMARVLLVATREPQATPRVRQLEALALRFLRDAQDFDGAFRNRRDRKGRWQGKHTLEDCWGRSTWALGTAASHSSVEWIRQTASLHFERAATRRSRFRRATAFAALGAAEVLADEPDSRAARSFLVASADGMVRPADDPTWPWPEARLAYANAVLPEAMIATGAALDRQDLLERGLDLLGWLLDHETTAGRLSVTPAGGAGQGDSRPAYDQQPIEVAALADACARAARHDDAPLWSAGVELAVAWFLGDNDAQVPMWDPVTGGGYDGVMAGGVNLNQGTESTLALLSTLQHARHLTVVTS